jgi:hypothetical protein
MRGDSQSGHAVGVVVLVMMPPEVSLRIAV